MRELEDIPVDKTGEKRYLGSRDCLRHAGQRVGKAQEVLYIVVIRTVWKLWWFAVIISERDRGSFTGRHC